MSERKYVNYNVGTLDDAKQLLHIALPFFGEETFKLVEPENETTGGPARVILYRGNRVGSLFVPESGPAFRGPIAFPAVHDGRVRMAELQISIWPPDADRNNKINVTMSQIKNLDDLEEREPAVNQGSMFA